MKQNLERKHLRQRLAGALLAAALFSSPAAPPAFAGEEPPAAPQGEGERFTMNIKDMALSELLQMISAQRRISIVCSSDVAGTVSVNLFDVTLDEALDAVLTANGFTFTRRGKVIYVHKPQPKATEIVTKSFDVAWADPTEIVKVLTEMKSEAGKVVRSLDSTKVVVRDEGPVVDQMARVIESLDTKPRQVLITTWVMELGDSDLKKIGVNWASLDQLKVFEFTGEGSYSRSNTRTDNGEFMARDFNEVFATSVDMRAGILSDNQFNLLLSFFDTLTQSKIVSEPRVMTLENKPANIIVGTIVPIPLFDFTEQTGTRILSGFQDQKVGTEVIVTPRVHAESYITLDINPKVEQIVDYIVVGGEKQRPIVSTRQAKTTVMVKSGDIVVIGGLRDESHSLHGSQVPFLHTIPVLGWLFKNRSEDNRVTDLTIFIKPELFDEASPLSLEERAAFDSFKHTPIKPLDLRGNK